MMEIRMGIAAITIACISLGVSGCATPISTYTDYDRTVPFDDYEVFSWISEKPLVTAPRTATVVNPFVESRIMAAVRKELTAQGYRFAENNSEADFVVSFAIGARQDISVDSYPVAYRSGWRWGTTYIGDKVSVDHTTEGMLSIDFFDQATRSPVWHGVAKKNLTTADEQLRTSIIDDAVREVLRSFPPNIPTN